MQIDLLKEQIKRLEPETLAAHGVITPAKTRANGRPTFICPECGNGTGKTGDGLVVYDNPDGYAYHCNKSGCHFDNISLLALYYGLDLRADFIEILRRAAAEFGIFTGDSFSDYHSLQKNSNPKQHNTPIKKEKTADEIAQDSLLADMIEDVIAKSIELLELLPVEDRRGLTLETLKYFRCGYLPVWIHPKILMEDNPKNVQPTRRLIIPISIRHYIAVALNSDRSNIKKDYWKMKAKTDDYTGFFGSQTIKANTEYIFVYEGEIDAMTAWQADQPNIFLKSSMNIFGVESAVDMETGEIISADNLKTNGFIATGSASVKSWVKALDCICRHYGIKPRIIILFDNDDAGRTNAPKRQQELMQLGYSTIVKFISNKE